MEKNKFSIKYKLEKRDYYLFNKWYNYKNIKLLIIVLFILFCFCILQDYKNIINKNFTGLITNSFVFGLLFLFSLVIIEIIVRIRSSIIFKQDKLLKSEIKLKLNSENIEEITDQSNLNLKWDDVYKIVFRKKYIYIMLSKVRGLIIPLKHIKNQSIIDLIKSKK